MRNLRPALIFLGVILHSFVLFDPDVSRADCTIGQYLELDRRGLSNIEVARICSGPEAAREPRRNSPSMNEPINPLSGQGKPATMCVTNAGACQLKDEYVGNNCSCMGRNGNVLYGTAR